MAGMEMSGMDAILSKLEGMATKTANAITKDALTKAGQLEADEMEKEAPKEANSKGMSKSITISGVKTKNGIKYVEIKPDKKHFYYNFVELGTKKGIVANPFMARSFAKNKNKIKEIVTDELKKGLGL